MGVELYAVVRVVGIGIGKRVQGIAVRLQFPVRTPRGHFVRKRQNLGRRRMRIAPAVKNQHFGSHF